MNSIKNLGMTVALVVLSVGALAGCVWSASLLATGGAVMVSETLTNHFCTATSVGC